MTFPRGCRALPGVLLSCAFALLVVVVSAALLTVAMLAPAPPVVLPLVILVGIGGPMAAAHELSCGLRVLRDDREDGRRHAGANPLDADALERLCDHLAALPETPHPLGL